jgi:hypothetical protein
MWKGGALVQDRATTSERMRIMASSRPVIREQLAKYAPERFERWLRDAANAERGRQAHAAKKKTAKEKETAERKQRRQGEQAVVEQSHADALDIQFRQELDIWDKLGEIAPLYHGDRERYYRLFSNGSGRAALPSMAVVFSRTLAMIEARYFLDSRSASMDRPLGALQLWNEMDQRLEDAAEANPDFEYGLGKRRLGIVEFMDNINHWLSVTRTLARQARAMQQAEDRLHSADFIREVMNLTDSGLKRAISSLSTEFE